MHEHRQCILTIEDEEDMRGSIKAYLHDCGFRIIEAASGEQGMELLEREHPDLVLTDLKMPGMDGYTVISEIKKRYSELPIIVISGAGLASEAINAVRQGAWDYITKPISDFGELEKTVLNVLLRAEQRRREVTYSRTLHRLVNVQARKLRHTEEKYRELVEQANSIILKITPSGDVTFINEYA